MSQSSEGGGARAEPVQVDEGIPVAGDHAVARETIRDECIPTPANLCLYPELGRGAMGRVHPAVDRNLLRPVALKRLAKELAVEPFYRDGFVAEAQMTGQLEHPNIVPVHELGVSEEGVPYFTMKLVQGVGFDAWLRARPPGSPERMADGLEIFLKICDAIAYAHDRGVIHRDLKPENIMVGTFGQVYVMDWGLARLTKSRPRSGSRAQMEAPGPVGTPEYMSPEQARGDPREMDERTDVFGLGAVLYKIVTGQLPYGRVSNADEILALARAGKTVPVESSVRRALPKRIAAIIDKAIAVDPRERYATVVELAADVRRFLRGGLHLPTKTFAEGEIILREGDPGDEAYMITRGSCRAYRAVDGREETLATMGVGDVFGEMALLLYEPRAASVVAIEPVTVVVVDKRTLAEGLGIDGWSGALVRALAHRFRDLEQEVRSAGLRRT
ncbi:MAG TPA: serine/threonine-protein kinase [Minicystis sp.]|nr:serine/threonine-protein kinase [Minicystis sp.]